VPPALHFAFLGVVFQAVLNEVMCRAGSETHRHTLDPS
jgi:hypothetical protein